MATVLLVLVVGAIAGLIYVLVEHSGKAVTFATVAAVPLAAGALLPLIFGGRRRPGDRLGVCTPEQLDRAQEVLAGLVLQQWREEIAIRQLDDPAPLAVRWQLTELPVMDHANHLTRPTTLRFLFQRGRPRFAGRTDRIPEMVGEFRNLARRRLVILGEPGMGKTTLAVLLLRHLLQHPRPGEPVPVLVTLSGWDPAEPFRDWLTNRLSDTYPALRARIFGPDAPRALVTGRRILPILDGLDEIPEPLRAAVITKLNATFTDTDALILTCRTSEYQTAINAPGGDVLTAGAVIEPRPLRPADAAAYLTHTLPPQPSRSWRTLLGILNRSTDTPLSRALSTPLTLWLLRKVYIDAREDPAPLLTPDRFSAPEQITDHLLDHLTEALITANPPSIDDQGDNRLFRPRHAWNSRKLSQAETNRWARGWGDLLRDQAPDITSILYMGRGYATNGTGKNLADHFAYWMYPQYPSKYLLRRLRHAAMRTRGVNPRSVDTPRRIPVARMTSTWPPSFTPSLPSGLTCGWTRPHIWQFTDNYRGLDASVSWLTLDQLAHGGHPQPQEDDVPEYVSLGIKNPQAVKKDQAAHAVFDVEYGDTGKAHSDGAFPGILSGGAHKTSFTATVEVSGAGNWRFVETDPAKKYAVTKSYPMRSGAFTENGKVEPNQHLYIELHPAADGAMNVAVKCHYWRLPA